MSTVARTGMGDPRFLDLYPDPNYPHTDGKPMAEDTTQYQWIVTIVEGIRELFAPDPDVFVAGDLFWYPVEGHAEIRTAPDALVVFGRPAGHRGSYKQFREGNIPPQVVFEVISKSNRAGEMAKKLAFYDRHGVEEYYVHDPHRKTFRGYLRGGEALDPIAEIDGWISPRLGIRFDLRGEYGLTIVRPDGRIFLTFAEVALAREKAALLAKAEGKRAEAERQKAEAERQKAETERQKAETERQRADRLAAKLRALGLDPED